MKVSGCTVHFADATYDTGPIILQRTVPVLDDDTPATLAARVFEAECQALPEAIALYAAGRLKVDRPAASWSATRSSSTTHDGFCESSSIAHTQKGGAFRTGRRRLSLSYR